MTTYCDRCLIRCTAGILAIYATLCAVVIGLCLTGGDRGTLGLVAAFLTVVAFGSLTIVNARYGPPPPPVQRAKTLPPLHGGYKPQPGAVMPRPATKPPTPPRGSGGGSR